MHSIEVKLHRQKKPTQSSPKREVWMLRWWTASGKRRGEVIGECTRMSKRDAERIRRERQSELDTGSIEPDKPEKITLDQLWTAFRNDRQHDIAATTLENYRSAIEHVERLLGKQRPLAEYTLAVVNHLKAELSCGSRSPATVSKILVQLGAIFSWGMDNGHVRENPFRKVKRAKQQRRQSRTFRRDELRAIVEACPSAWWRAFVLFAISTGCRRDEILHMTWQDVNLFKGIAVVSAKR